MLYIMLKNDHTHLYLNYIGTEYRVSRSDGSIEYMAKGIWKLCKEYTIVMTIYDLLCYSEDKPLPLLIYIIQCHLAGEYLYMITHIRISALCHHRSHKVPMENVLVLLPQSVI